MITAEIYHKICGRSIEFCCSIQILAICQFLFDKWWLLCYFYRMTIFFITIIYDEVFKVVLA